MGKNCDDLKGADFDACIYAEVYDKIKTIANNHELRAHVRIAKIQLEIDDFDSEHGLGEYRQPSSAEIQRAERNFGA